MAWIKRNLLFSIGGILALVLLGAASFYNFTSWRHNAKAFDRLTEAYNILKDLNNQKPSPGNDRVNNISAAAEEERQLRDWIRQAGKYFEPIPCIPNATNETIASENFASALHRTIDQMQRAAANASVALPPRYSFSFEAERSLVKFAPGSLGPLAVQLGEVKAIGDVFFAAKVNSLDGIQRERVSDDDANGPQPDYLTEHSVTNDMAVVTPYMLTFRCFGPELAHVLAGFASSRHGFIVKGINVDPAGASAATASDLPGSPPSSQPLPPPFSQAPPPAAGRGGLQTVLDEQLLRVTLAVEIVKLTKK